MERNIVNYKYYPGKPIELRRKLVLTDTNTVFQKLRNSNRESFLIEVLDNRALSNIRKFIAFERAIFSFSVVGRDINHEKDVLKVSKITIMLMLLRINREPMLIRCKMIVQISPGAIQFLSKYIRACLPKPTI